MRGELRSDDRMIFGTLDGFVESGSTDLMLGKQVANLEFLSALLTHGSFSEYHFFLPNDTTTRHFSEVLQKRNLRDEVRGKIKLFSPLSLRERLSEQGYTVFHHSDFLTYIPSFCFIRNRFAAARFPITGVTHSLSYRENFLNLARMLYGGVRPYDSIICTSTCAKEALLKVMEIIKENLRVVSGGDAEYRGRLDVIPLGVEVERFQGIDKEDARRTLGLPADAHIVLGLSRFSVYTKMDLFPLLNSFRIVLDRIKPQKALLLLAGGDELNYIPALRNFAEQLGIGSSVHFKKDFPETEKPLLFAAADIFVSPSDNLQETFGLSVIEAMASGRPVVVSDFDGYKDLVVHGETGFRVPTFWLQQHDRLSTFTPILFRPNYHLYYAQALTIDVRLMADHITTLLLNKNMREEMGQKALARVKGYFSWDVVIRQYEALWQELSSLGRKDKEMVEVNDPFNLDYSNIFRHYVTGVIKDEDVIKTTTFGKDIMGGRFTFPIYQDMTGLIDSGIIMAIISLCGEGVRVGELLHSIARKAGHSKDEVSYHIMWMLKQNMIELGESIS